MNILYSSDENYSKISMVSIASLLENNMNSEEIRIYYIDCGISDDSRKMISNLVHSFSRKIYFISAEDIDTSFIRRTGFAVSGYYRLLITTIIPEEKILYLDGDTLIKGDISELYNIDLKDNIVAAVKDTVEDFMAESVTQSNSHYINSGMMLMDLKKMRDLDFSKLVVKCFDKFYGYVPHHDQGVINYICNGRILYVSPKYNFMSQYFLYSEKQLKRIFKIRDLYTQEVIEEAREQLVVVHFLNKFYGRPWEHNCEHPYKNEFLQIAQKYHIDIELRERKKDPKRQMRKKAFKVLPFFMYELIEKLLYYKRKKEFNVLYKVKNESITN